jgi:hypothetical protein
LDVTRFRRIRTSRRDLANSSFAVTHSHSPPTARRYGKCEVFLDHVHIRTLQKRDYFGEIALITDVRRTASVQAST